MKIRELAGGHPLALFMISCGLIFGVGTTAAACGGEHGQNAVKMDRNTAPADMINFPDGFRNVAHKCDGPNMVYVTSHGDDTTAYLPSSVFVVPNDPRCGKAQ